MNFKIVLHIFFLNVEYDGADPAFGTKTIVDKKKLVGKLHSEVYKLIHLHDIYMIWVFFKFRCYSYMYAQLYTCTEFRLFACGPIIPLAYTNPIQNIKRYE